MWWRGRLWDAQGLCDLVTPQAPGSAAEPCACERGGAVVAAASTLPRGLEGTDYFPRMSRREAQLRAQLLPTGWVMCGQQDLLRLQTGGLPAGGVCVCVCE